MTYELHTQAIQSLFEGKATVTVKESYKDPVTKVTKTRENVIYTEIPCRLSYGSNSTKEGLGGCRYAFYSVRCCNSQGFYRNRYTSGNDRGF